jgi:ribosomal protein S18 acetylase RimI-like enzyme
MSVRDAVPADAEAIAAINLASWEAAYRGIVTDRFLDGVTLGARTAGWRERIETATNGVLVAVEAARLVGYCLREAPSPELDAEPSTAKITALYVSPGSFRGGVGSILMENTLQRLGAASFSVVTLWVLSANHRARAFYTHHGFLPDGDVRFDEVLEAEETRLRREI